MDERPLLDPPGPVARVASGLAAVVIVFVLAVALLRVPVDALNAATFARGQTEPGLVVDVVPTGDGDEGRVESVVETLPGVLLAYGAAHPAGTLVDVVTVPFGDRAYPPAGPGPAHGGSVPIAVACLLVARPLVRAARGAPPPSTVEVRHLTGLRTMLGHSCVGAIGWMVTTMASLSGLGWWAAAVVAAGQLWLARRFGRARLEVGDERWTVRPVLRRPFVVELDAVTPGSLFVHEFGPPLDRRVAVFFPSRRPDTGSAPASATSDPTAIGWLSKARLRSVQPERWHGDGDLARRLLDADPAPAGSGVDRLRRLAADAVPVAPPTWPSSD